MKKLTRMKLINWHRFVNTTLEFGDSTLVSGENGAGKSTLLDAIQFVVTCSANSFNKAAHENGKRKLTGYIRCKTGRENQPYERTGEISAHIALEFYEESKQQYFIVGAVIDSAAEGQETTVRYLIDKTKLSDDLFLKGIVPKTITEFRSTNKGIKQWAKTNTEAKRLMKTRFGRIEDKFFHLIPKAMAFKPIDDIKDFVYSYVLDAKEVNIDMLRENVRSYQDLERTLESVKSRIAKLEAIEKYYTEVQNCAKNDAMYDYFLTHADLDLLQTSITETEQKLQKYQFQKQAEERQAQALNQEKEEKQAMETNLRVEMKQNKEFLALEEEQRKLEHYQAQEKEELLEKAELKNSAKQALRNVEDLLKVTDIGACIKQYEQILRDLEHLKDIVQAKQTIEEVLEYKRDRSAQIQHKRAETQIALKGKKTQREELAGKIEKLKRKQLSYPESVNRLKTEIELAFSKIGRKTVPHVLCELLEIKDEIWRNAVEGYLNTQRFYIIVEPESFDIALGVYDKLRKEKKAYGVGLINARKLEAYETAPAETLASVVESGNLYAKRYINMILGKVHLCNRYEELKKYDVAITKECMRYQNHVASAIKPDIFEKPFIGQNAVRVQLAQTRKQYDEFCIEISKEQARLKQLEASLLPLETEADVDIKYRIDVLAQLQITQNNIKTCRDNIKTLKKNATLIQKQVQLEVLEKQRKELEVKLNQANRKIGNTESDIRNASDFLQSQMSRWSEQAKFTTQSEVEAGDALDNWKAEYEKLTASRSLSQVKENYERRKKANLTIQQKAEDNMRDVMVTYKTEHDFGAPATLLGYPEFAMVYDRLKNSELLSYEEKVQKARIAAEEEFREQFLSKLQENIRQAQTEFKELNRALKDITFSNEQYEFIHLPSKHYRNYYEMIMDDFNAMQGESIFAGMFHENHKEVIDELFSKLALDNENESKALEEFTDYRTYMDYDIRIIHRDGNYSLYSKVCEEKSGGETQTPFYVTVAASFVQLYGNNIGGEAIGLVMFDEAFNNMDDERISGVLQFFKRLPLQIIIAAPPDKIQYISPEMEETMLVLTDEKISYVEAYHHDILRETNS